MRSTSAGAPVPFDDDAPAAAVSALTNVIRSELRLLEELMAIIQRQRQAVAGDNLQLVEDCVYATHRVLHTLKEARRRRPAVNRMLGESDDLSIHELDNVLGIRMSGELRKSRDELEMLARALSREVEVNRRVLRQALTAADGAAGALYGTPEPKLGGCSDPPSDPPAVEVPTSSDRVDPASQVTP
jgi:hypothetical protein